MEFSTTKITPNDNVKIPSINGDNAGYMETDELKEYMNDGLITQSITDGDTDHAPSSDAVNGALNAINEYGSNANGHYLKFSSGIVIEWGSIDGISSEILGQSYRTVTLPVPLISTSGVFGIASFYDSFRGHSSGSVPNIADVTSVSLTGIELMLTINNTYDSNNIVRWLAIGRWK